jgi:hypothetical protein
MRNRAFSSPAVTGRSFERTTRAALFGLVYGASACSGFSSSDCKANRACTAGDEAPPSTGSDGAAPAADGGAGGRPQSSAGAAGAGGSGGTVAAPGATDAKAAAGGASDGRRGAAGSDPSSDATPDGGASDNDAGRTGDGDRSSGGAGGAPAGSDDVLPVPCTGSWADCDGVRADGCEVDVASNTTHCGACGRPCGTAGATGTECVQGECKPTCDARHADCDGNPDNGCETDTTTDQYSCGACGHACSMQNASGAICVAGACKATCAGDHADCSKPKSPAKDDGCETNLTLEASCGACGHDCQGGACRAGQCQPTVVASGLGSPVFLTLVGKVPYVVEFDSAAGNEQVVRIDANGAVFGLFTFGDLIPSGLASQGTYVYLAVPSTSAAGDPPNGAIARFDVNDDIDLHGLRLGIDPQSLAVDGANIYWGDDDGVYQQGIGVDTSLQLTTGSAGELVSDGTTVYGSSDTGGTIFSVPVGGGTWNQHSSIVGEALMFASRYVAVDAQHAYAWLYSPDGVVHLWQLAKPTFRMLQEITASTIDSFTAPLFADGSYVYFGKNGGLYRASTTTSAPATLVANLVGSLSAVTVANGALYWLDTGKGAADGSLNRLVL